MARRILVVEVPEIAEMIRRILKPHGYEITCADLPQALTRFRSPSPGIDLVVTGAAQFLQTPVTAPIVYLTPYAGHQPPEIRKGPGVSVLIKPFLPVDLVRVVQNALAMHPAGLRLPSSFPY